MIYTRLSDYVASHQLAAGEYVLEAETELDAELEAARSRHPSAPSRYVGTFEDGSQVFVEEHALGKLTAATRADRFAVWGPPAMLNEAP